MVLLDFVVKTVLHNSTITQNSSVEVEFVNTLHLHGQYESQ